jgi:hypothetical protein
MLSIPDAPRRGYAVTTQERDKRKRPTIPPNIEKELWARAAGRCEFRGCNELLYIDGLTQKRSNLATVSHIVGWSPDGPRGHPTRSFELEKAISNLMLTCKKHGKLMDDKDKEADYPEQLLLEFKGEHETRVRMLTDVTGDAQTHVILLNASIDKQQIGISEKAAYRAILPKYSDSEAPTIINLSGLAISNSTEGFFSVTTAAISTEIRKWLSTLPHGRPDKSVSVFALAPIPLLVHLGFTLGDIMEVELYQRHRTTQDWVWNGSTESVEATPQLYDLDVPDAEIPGNVPLVVAISVSATVHQEQITSIVGENAAIYSMRANEPGLDFLGSKKRLEIFGYELRRLLELIRDRHGRERSVHLIAAVPSPAAIEIGRSLRAYHPPVDVYEYEKSDETYRFALTVNE